MALEFSRDQTKFCKICRSRALFCLEFPGVKELNFPQGIFSRIAQHIQCLIQEIESHLQ